MNLNTRRGVDWGTHLEVDCALCVEKHRGYWKEREAGADLKTWDFYVEDCSHCNDRGRDPIPWTELFAGYRERKWEEK